MKKGWTSKPLGDLCEVFTDGNWIESKDQSSEGIRLIQTGNVGQGVFKDRGDKARYISEATFKRLRCTEIFEGDCLVSRLPDPVGRSCILPDSGERMITAVDCTILRFNTKQFLPEFFNYYSQSDDYISTVAAECTGTTRNRISRSNLGLTPIPVPPLPEQRRIVSILDEAFAGLATAKANAEKNLHNARALFESHLQSVFSQRGKGWVETTLDKISTNLDSKRVPITKNVRSSGEYPYYGASGIVDYVADYIFEGDNLLVSEDGANLLARSTPIAFSVTGKYWVNNHAHILHFENMATQRFAEFYLESIKLDEYITGAAQPKLNQKALNSIPIPIPTSVDEQAMIVKSVQSLQEETTRLAAIYQQKLAALEALKKSLLHQAFSGEL
jgi:type I restriction enzyme S subunit